MPEEWKEMTPRRFRLVRFQDPTGISGTGVVAEGCQMSDGSIIMLWLTETRSLAFYQKIEDVVRIHGHNGATVVDWIDPE